MFFQRNIRQKKRKTLGISPIRKRKRKINLFDFKEIKESKCHAQLAESFIVVASCNYHGPVAFNRAVVSPRGLRSFFRDHEQAIPAQRNYARGATLLRR